MNITVVDVEETVERALKAKALWLDWAEIIDAYRLVPRGVLAAVTKLTLSGCTTMVYWYIHLPTGQRTTADAAAVVSIVTVLTALLGASFAFYIQNGRRWTDK